MHPNIVIDTNVVVAGLRSQHGRSFELLFWVGRERFTIHVSVPLILEYEKVLRDQQVASESVIEAVLDYHCAVGKQHQIYFLWRPHLLDPKDDMVLELAVAGECSYIVTFNTGDFSGSERFGIKALTSDLFLTR